MAGSAEDDGGQKWLPLVCWPALAYSWISLCARITLTALRRVRVMLQLKHSAGSGLLSQDFVGRFSGEYGSQVLVIPCPCWTAQQ